MKIAVISDLHYAKSDNITNPERSGTRALELLKRSIALIETELHADLLLLGGDLINDSRDLDLLREIAGVMKQVTIPWIAVPGNHDPSPDTFYTIMPRPAEYLDLQGIRFIPFTEDPETPGWNSKRSIEEIRRMKELAGSGPAVIFQHVPLFRPGSAECPYNYENAEEIYQAAEGTGIVLSISGHWHKGYCPAFTKPFTTAAVPALCEIDFPVTEIELTPSGRVASFKLHYLNQL